MFCTSVNIDAVLDGWSLNPSRCMGHLFLVCITKSTCRSTLLFAQ